MKDRAHVYGLINNQHCAQSITVLLCCWTGMFRDVPWKCHWLSKMMGHKFIGLWPLFQLWWLTSNCWLMNNIWKFMWPCINKLLTPKGFYQTTIHLAILLHMKQILSISCRTMRKPFLPRKYLCWLLGRSIEYFHAEKSNKKSHSVSWSLTE